MSSSYPGALDTTTKFPQTIEDDIDSKSGADLGTSTTVGFLAQLLRDLGDAVVKLETELGVNPSASFTDVVSRLNQITTVRKTADQNFTTTTLASVTDMVFPVVVGGYYKFEFYAVWSAATAGVTQQFAVTFPAATYGIYSSEAFAVTAVGSGDSGLNATDMVSTSVVTASGTKVGSIGGTSIPAANTKTVTRITGILANVTSAGNIQLQAATETASTSTCFAGSHGVLWTN